MGKGLIKAIPALIQNIPQIITAIVDVFLAFNWLNIGKTVVTGLGNGLKSMVSSLKGIAKQLADAVKGGFANLPQAMLGIGKNIVQGLWKGISAMKDWALGKIKEFVGGIVGGIKNLLGIHSPSKVFAEIGGNITRGLSNGITENGGLGPIFKRFKIVEPFGTDGNTTAPIIYITRSLWIGTPLLHTHPNCI